MAEINICDVSIGDWVRHTFYEENLQIKRIDGESERLLVEKGRMSVSCHLDHFEPIPLTAEILEKNGFVRNILRQYAQHQCFEIDNIQVETFSGGREWRVVITDKLIAGLVLCNVVVKHTHQLQHALRLAGVRKEIEV